jgi:superfamily II DNA or RNA helicase
MRNTTEIDRLIAAAEEKLARLDAGRAEILERIKNWQREKRLGKRASSESTRDNKVLVTNRSPQDAKIALFRSLFRGRGDVYPRRFESARTGKQGYQPACGNEWLEGVCRKPAIRCGECANRDFLPVTDVVIRNHLLGVDPQDKSNRGFTIGVYPLLLDETCWFLAADFDKTTWMKDAAAFLETCKAHDVPAALERSRSGNGGHVWIFFAEPLSATLARNLGSFILTETMERRPGIGLDSYDRFFPSQNTLPKGGFGNLIALPLQKKPRKRGNSLFLDEESVPYADQWTFLASLRRMSREEAETVVDRAVQRGRIVAVRTVTSTADDLAPWTIPPSRRRTDPPIVGPLPRQVRLVLGNQIYLAKEALPPALQNRLIRLAAFQNPEFYKAQAMRLPTFNKPRIINCCEDFPQHIGLPRGCLDDVIKLLQSLKIETTIIDERFSGALIDLHFQGTLRPEQALAVNAMLKYDTGVLSATTAFGKTVVAAYLIATRRVNTLVLVHRRQLLDQWIARLSGFLGLEPRAIGRIGGGTRKPLGIVDVAIIQSLSKKGVVDDIVGNYGHLIVDECHHISARSFEIVARQCKAKYVTGLSATVTRKDGHHPIIFMQCGPIRYSVDDRRQAATRPFTHKVIVRKTKFALSDKLKTETPPLIHQLYSALMHDESRNRMIVEDVLAAVGANRSPVVLTERTEHLALLADRLCGLIRNVVVMKGGMGQKQRRLLAEKLLSISDDEQRVIIATGRYLGEGFDDARLDTLFLTLPVSWRGTLTQYAGRLHRLHDMKKEVVIYDYADLEVPMLVRMYQRRCSGYRAIGYEIAE